MVAVNDDREFVAYVVELMQTLGAVRARRMFGGSGLFLDGLMFALIADGTLYLKSDAGSAHCFTDRGLERFTYHKNNREYSMSYYRAPEETLEDSEEMAVWIQRAFAVARRAAQRRPAKKSDSTQ